MTGDKARRPAYFISHPTISIVRRVNLDLETGEIERLPTPGPAYADDPEMAPRCK